MAAVSEGSQGNQGTAPTPAPTGTVGEAIARERQAGALVFLHLSDIHLHYRKLNDVFDPDADIRNELLRDLRVCVASPGGCTGILISGDIAHSGQATEYDVAHEWISQLTNVVQCPNINVWTVPGNHDIDRKVLERSTAVQKLRARLRTANIADLDRELREAISDEMYAAAFFTPLSAYNAFAARYNCDISPEQPMWEDRTLALNDGTRLHMRGLTSPFISDAADDVESGKLVLGRFQAVCPRSDGVEHLVICHHPPQWLRDQDEVTNLLDARSRLQLYGHKHVQSIRHLARGLVLHAGALHPERSEGQWQPRYNLLCLRVEVASSGERTLKLAVAARAWDAANSVFKADPSPENDKPINIYSFVLESSSLVVPATTVEGSEPAPLPRDTMPSDVPPACTGEMDSPAVDSQRRFTFQFLSLPHAVRIAIAYELGLIEDSDEGIADAELRRRIVRRAYETDRLAILSKRVEQRYEEAIASRRSLSHE